MKGVGHIALTPDNLLNWRYIVDLSRIPAQPKPGLLNILIEITAGSKNKYELIKTCKPLPSIGYFIPQCNTPATTALYPIP